MTTLLSAAAAEPRGQVWLRWIARGLGGAAALFYLSFFVDTGLLGPQGFFVAGFASVPPRDLAGIVALCGCSVALLLAWGWPRLGGLGALCGLAAFAAVYPKSFPLWMFLATLAVAGLQWARGAREAKSSSRRDG